MSKKQTLLTTCLAVALVSDVGAIKIGFGTALNGVQDIQSNGGNNQMRQNINITNTVFLPEGTYRAASWEYNAAPDSATQGVTQPVFPFLTVVNGPANHTVLAFGDTIDTEPGVQIGVPFGGADDTFTIPIGGATVAAGVQNTNATGVQNSILTDTSFGNTDHANSGNFDEAGGVGNTLDSFGHANLPRTYAFAIEVEEENLVDGDGDGLPANWEDGNGLDDNDDGTAGESAPGAGDGPNGALGDPDSDGLNNAGEFDRDTDPQDPDSDGDGVNDGSEVEGGTEPDNPDSDGDGLLDGVETGTGSFVDANDTGTDPLDADSDGDLIPDGIEVADGFDPTDPNSRPEIDLAFHNPERILYRRTDNLPAADFTGALPENADQAAPFGVPDDPDSSLISALDVDREPGNGGIDLTGDHHDLAFILQFYDDDGVFSFTENYDDRVKIVATPIAGSGNLTATGAPAQHTDVNWNARTFANFDFGGGGWFNVDIWLTEDGGGAQSAADIGFGYFNGASSNTADFGGIGYTGVFGISSGAPAVFDTDGNGQSWGTYLDSFDPNVDSDGDSIPDGYEEQFFPADLSQLGPGDFDDDGLTDLEEYNAGTNPTEADSDDDGISDPDEIANGTDPTNPDSDDDGLLDGVETNTGTFVSATDTGTDPLNTDSDNDLMNDFDEVNSPTRDPNVSEAPEAGDLAEHLTVYYNFDENLQDQAHLIPGTASTAADDLEFIAPHPQTYDPGLFGGGGYFGPGLGGGHAQTAFSPDVDGDIAGPTREITVAWWGRVDAFNHSWQIGVGRGEGSNWRFHRWSGNPTMAWQGGSNDIHANAAEFNIDDGEWHHFVGTSNGVANVRALWIDGEEAVSTVLSGPLNSDPNLPLMIGNNPGDPNRQWNGGIDDVAIWRRALTGEQIQALYLAGTNGESLGDLITGPGLDPLGLAVSLASNDPLTIRAEFNTQLARQYDLLVSPDLNSAPESWTELAGFQDIPADPSGRASVDFPAPYAGIGFIAVREEGLPAFFTEDFESGAGDWVAVVNDAGNNTLWELGTPSGSTGPITGADGSANAFSTNLGDYGMDSDISLFSPPLDFSGLPGAELTFEAFRDADGFGDTATVRFRRVGDDVQLGADHALDMSVFDTDYETQVIQVPVEVINETENVRIEFNFVSDGTADAFSGLSIDDVRVDVTD